MIPGSAIPLLLATAGPTFDPRSYFDVKLYTGNGSTQTISGLNFSPDLVWTKSRSGGTEHGLFDTVRGVSRFLGSSTTLAEIFSAGNYLTSFDANGFGVGGGNVANDNGGSYVAWTWDAGSSTVTNTQGSITSQVRANASAGFSVVTYTGTGSLTATFGHGLGVTPGFFIIKNRSSSCNWMGYHSATGKDAYYDFNTTNAVQTTIPNIWGTSGPSSSLITVTGPYLLNNQSGQNYVCYAWSPVAGYSSFGSYTGNGSATGPVISGLGFQPYFVMIKASSTTGDWWMYDGARSPSNPRINKLKANTSGAEDTAGEDVDFQLGGFQIKTSDSGLNQNAATYIYAAFA
jgi:hypothetical protein